MGRIHVQYIICLGLMYNIIQVDEYLLNNKLTLMSFYAIAI